MYINCLKHFTFCALSYNKILKLKALKIRPSEFFFSPMSQNLFYVGLMGITIFRENLVNVIFFFIVRKHRILFILNK